MSSFALEGGAGTQMLMQLVVAIKLTLTVLAARLSTYGVLTVT